MVAKDQGVVISDQSRQHNEISFTCMFFRSQREDIWIRVASAADGSNPTAPPVAVSNYSSTTTALTTFTVSEDKAAVGGVSTDRVYFGGEYK